MASLGLSCWSPALPAEPVPLPAGSRGDVRECEWGFLLVCFLSQGETYGPGAERSVSFQPLVLEIWWKSWLKDPTPAPTQLNEGRGLNRWSCGLPPVSYGQRAQRGAGSCRPPGTGLSCSGHREQRTGHPPATSKVKG